MRRACGWPQISTVNMGLAVGWSCCVLAFGKKGWRKSLPHSLAMIQQPRAPPTGQRQAVEVHIKWREVLDYKRELLRMMSIGTGWGVDKLDAVSKAAAALARVAGTHMLRTSTACRVYDKV